MCSFLMLFVILRSIIDGMIVAAAAADCNLPETAAGDITVLLDTQQQATHHRPQHTSVNHKT
jgi:hypothetical protein